VALRGSGAVNVKPAFCYRAPGNSAAVNVEPVFCTRGL